MEVSKMRASVLRAYAALILSAPTVGCVRNDSLGHQADMSILGTTSGDMTPDYSGLDVEPSALQTISVAAGSTLPTVGPYTATLLGTSIAVRWSVDRGDIGSIDIGETATANFTPRGTTGGLVTILAALGSTTIKRQVMVKLTTAPQNGYVSNTAEQAQVPSSAAALAQGGGVGGVGGEGLGVAVTDGSTLTALGAPAENGSAQHLTFLYPYDKTVWPRGMLAPLLMWKWDSGDADAIKIDLSTSSGSFTWSGTFGRPAILQTTGGSFIRHPIPQDVWDMATNSAGGTTPDGKPDKLSLKLTIAKSGQAYGPVAETWAVAPARLTGSVYYSAYGSGTVRNGLDKDTAGNWVGAAILGIRSGATAPKVIVGQDTPGAESGCVDCHVVAARGRWLIAQQTGAEQGSDLQSFAYDLQAADIQGSRHALPPDGTFAWAAMLKDASYVLTNTVEPANTAILTATTSSFWSFGSSAGPQAATASGLPSSISAGYPIFSPDDRFVAYIDATGNPNVGGGPLTVGNFDESSRTFSNLQAIHSAPMGDKIGYPAFLPDDSGIVFETGLRASQCDPQMVTRCGARGELWWINMSGTPTAVTLDALNGKSGNAVYLPLGPNNHGTGATSESPTSSYSESGLDDTTLNYEPTVLPIVAGGYAWVVFTSRRLYGNQATALPWKGSDPTQYDTTSFTQVPTKKLWVAAINLGAAPGSDPSSPAFYLPAQELMAGNSRGYWVLDPCQGDGNRCDTGDQCCGGCCQPNGTGGALICQSPPPDGHCSSVANCSGVQEQCTTSADCCDSSNVCAGGFCAYVIE